MLKCCSHRAQNRQNWRPSCHTETLWGDIQKGGWLAVAFTFLVGDSGFSGASVPGASGFVTQLSATAMLGSREREKEWLLKESSRERQQVRGEPHLFLIHSCETKSACFICLFRPVDWLRERTWADARSLAGYSILGAVSQGRLKRIDSWHR